MNFEQYKEIRDNLLEKNSIDYFRMDCLNPFKAMDFLLKGIDIDFENVENIEVTKEELLELWKEKNHIQQYDFTITRGVRDSLYIIFNSFKDKNIIIPNDVYPKYVYISEVNKKNRVFYNLNNNGLLNVDINVKNSLLLLECPITPEGRLLNQKEINHLLKFLEEKSNVIVIDTVYAYKTKEVFDLLSPLIQTEQCLVLHSISKTYLSPEVLGINYFPKQYEDSLDFSYKYEQYPLKNEDYSLKRAYLILKNLPGLSILQEELFKKEFKIINTYLNNKMINQENSMGYFRKVKSNFNDELKERKMIVPNSIFNTENNNINSDDVVTCLYYMNVFNLNS